MLKLILSCLKWLSFSVVILIAGYKIHWNEMSLSEHVEEIVSIVENDGFPMVDKKLRHWMNSTKKKTILKHSGQ